MAHMKAYETYVPWPGSVGSLNGKNKLSVKK